MPKRAVSKLNIIRETLTIMNGHTSFERRFTKEFNNLVASQREIVKSLNFATFGGRVVFCMDFTCPCLCDVGLK